MQDAASGSGGGDQMIAVIASDQGNMQGIQSRIVSRLVSLLGVRWSSSLNRWYVGPLVEEIVVTGGIVGVRCEVQRHEGRKCERRLLFIIY